MDLHSNTDMHFGSGRTVDGDNWIKVARGIYWDASARDSTMDAWESNKLITKVRARGVNGTRQDIEPVFTSQVGLILHGLPTWQTVPDLVAWGPPKRKPNGKKKTFEQVTLGEHYTPPATFSYLNGARLGEKTVEIDGIKVAHHLECAVDAARQEHPMVGIAAVSLALGICSHFNMRDQESTRAKAEELRAQMLKPLTSDVWGAKKARKVIEAADPGISNAAEAFVWWLLCCITEPGDRATQIETRASDRTYFIDMGLPRFKFGVENEGVTKFALGQQDHRGLTIRHNDLLNEGWVLLHLSTNDSYHPDLTMQKLQTALKAAGVPLSEPDRTLWQPVPWEILDPRRRF